MLDHLAPIGLAAALGTALVVDLRLDRPGYGAELTVADLLRDGVRRSHLGPTRRGVAVLGAADVPADEVCELVGHLEQGWPGVVVRTGWPAPVFPMVEVHPVFPAGPWPAVPHPAVFQRVLPGHRPDVDGVLLPRLSRGCVAAMLAGRVHPRWRWIRAWRAVWERTWD